MLGRLAGLRSAEQQRARGWPNLKKATASQGRWHKQPAAELEQVVAEPTTTEPSPGVALEQAARVDDLAIVLNRSSNIQSYAARKNWILPS